MSVYGHFWAQIKVKAPIRNQDQDQPISCTVGTPTWLALAHVHAMERRRAHPSYVYGPAPGRGPSRSASGRHVSQSTLRDKMRGQEGMSTRPFCATQRRPSSAKSLGVQLSGEFRHHRPRSAACSSGGCPSSTSSSFVVSSGSNSGGGAEDSATAARRQLAQAARGEDPKDITGLIVADHEFGWVQRRRGRPDSAVRELIRAKQKPADIEVEAAVEVTLERLRGEYFPISRRWDLRTRAEQAPPPSRFRRITSGSMVVRRGQHRKYQVQSEKLHGRVSQMQRQVRLASAQLDRIRRQFAALSDRDNPTMTFPLFVDVMKAVGVRTRPQDMDFCRRLYKILDTDGDGTVNFEELLRGMSTLLCGSARQRLQLFYAMYAQHNPAALLASATKQAVLLRGLSLFNVHRVITQLVAHYEEPPGVDHEAMGQSQQQQQQQQQQQHGPDTTAEGPDSTEPANLSPEASEARALLSQLRRDCGSSAPKQQQQGSAGGGGFGDSPVVTFEGLWAAIAMQEPGYPALLALLTQGKTQLLPSSAGSELGTPPSQRRHSKGKKSGAEAAHRSRRRRRTRRRQPMHALLDDSDLFHTRDTPSTDPPDGGMLGDESSLLPTHDDESSAVLGRGADARGRGQVQEWDSEESTTPPAMAATAVASDDQPSVVPLVAANGAPTTQADESLDNGVRWHWHYGESWVRFDGTTERTLEIAYHSGQRRVILSSSVCAISDFFLQNDGQYEVNIDPTAQHEDIPVHNLPLHLRPGKVGPDGSIATSPQKIVWVGMTQLNRRSGNKRPVLRTNTSAPPLADEQKPTPWTPALLGLKNG
jgi:hypothetical protein